MAGTVLVAGETAVRGGHSLANALAPILAFNRGRISSKALARVDLQRMAFSAAVQTNLPPRILGSMTLRPGWEYLFNTANDAAAKYLGFVFSTTDTAMLEVTAGGIRIIVNDAVITRETVSTAVVNGTFDPDVTGWTDADESGCVSVWANGNHLSLIGTLFNAAIRRQQVTVASGDLNVEHGVTFTVARGPVTVKIGSTSGGAEYIAETDLNTGTYSFVFTPIGDFHIELAGRAQAASLVDSVAVDAGGDFTLPSPYGAGDLDLLRPDQSADVIFVACNGKQQRRIERFDLASKSWGISLYEPIDGPFRNLNTTSIKLTPSALTGDITLSASRDLFRTDDVGANFQITSIGQQVSSVLTGEDEFSDDIRVIGVESSRIFDLTISGISDSTVTLQRSIDETGSWADVASYTTAQAAVNYDDGLDNQIAYYRIGIKTGDYGTDTVTVTLNYASGGLLGVARVTAYTSPTSVSAAVLVPFGGTDASRDWAEGHWSVFRGYPSAAAFYEGRLWWAGRSYFFGSISDAFASFDQEFEGDAGPIIRNIGSGPVDNINWLLPLQRLIAGTAGAEVSARSTSFDEPLTPDNFNLKDASTQGSGTVNAIKVDQGGIFVQRSGTRVFELAFTIDKNDYAPTDLTDIIPEIGEPGIVRVAIQRQPDTRLHFVRSDGTVAMLIREPTNEVLCWLDIETNGSVEDVVIMPGTVEDRVHYQTSREINGSTVRFFEKWALESECVGGTVNKQADAFVEFSQAASSTISVPHLIGEDVVVWADGICLADSDGDIATFTVDGNGEITVTNRGSEYLAASGVAGLAYRGRFKSTKLAYASQLGTALTQRKRVHHLGLMLQDTHHKGVKIGPDFETMDDLPLIEEGVLVADDTVHASYDYDMQEWPGGWETDARMCLEMNAPRPATVLGVVVGIEEHDKT